MSEMLRKVQPYLDLVTFSEAMGGVVYVLAGIAERKPSLILWPGPDAQPAGAAEDGQRRERSRELERHFRDARLRARKDCPEPLLPQFEVQLCELEATVRAAVTGRLSPFVELSSHIREVEEFQRRWGPYIDPPQGPPSRVRWDEVNRSVWLDDRCLAVGLKRHEFEYFRALVKAHPNTLPWPLARSTIPGLLGKNQTRFKKGLPSPIRKLIETTATGSVLRLPAKLSTAV